MSAHRATGRARMVSHPVNFTARHCAGSSCFHAHPGQEPFPIFEDLTVPVPRCDRRGAHGGHDVTTPEGDYRCPGLASTSLPAPQLRKRVAQARAAIKGGAA